MIAKLEGKVIKKVKDCVILKVGGVGYRVFIPASLVVGANEGEELELWIAQVFREKEVSLYGFSSFEQLSLFELLLSVSGVGPKMALGVISQAEVEKIEKAVLGGNIEFFTRVSGIGKKNAARIILELKPKLDRESLTEIPAWPDSKAVAEVTSALKNLGYSIREIKQALKDVDPNLSLEEKVKQALRSL